MLAKPRCSLWYLVSSILLAGNVLAVYPRPEPEPGFTNAMDEVNDVDQATNTNGGCQDHMLDLTQAWNEMLSMIGGGRDSLHYVANTEQEPDLYAPVQSDALRHAMDFLRRSQPLRTLFGHAAGFEEIRSRANEVLQHSPYARLRAKNMVRQGPGGAPRYYIRCNDDWINYVPPTFEDPRDIGTEYEHEFTIADPNPEYPDREKFPNGAYHFPSLPDRRNLWWEEGYSQPDDPNPICKPGVRVESLPTLNLILWCNAAFLTSQWSLEEVEPEVRHGDRIDSPVVMATGAVQWLRELMDYTYQGSDDYFSSSWAESKAIAKANPTGAAKSEEAYVLYSIAMYLNRSRRGTLYWGTGRAQPTAEHEPFNPHEDEHSQSPKKSRLGKFKDKLKSVGGKKGQSSTNPNGRRAALSSGNGTTDLDSNEGSANVTTAPTRENRGLHRELVV